MFNGMDLLLSDSFVWLLFVCLLIRDGSDYVMRRMPFSFLKGTPDTGAGIEILHAFHHFVQSSENV